MILKMMFKQEVDGLIISQSNAKDMESTCQKNMTMEMIHG
jgi:hypothetical protein